jgi:hypothetical protein
LKRRPSRGFSPPHPSPLPKERGVRYKFWISILF